MKNIFIAFSLVFVFAMLLASCAAADEMAFMRATVNATDVNLRQGPSVKTTAMDAANTGDLLIVESDPIKNDEDGSEWYRIIEAPNRPNMKSPLYITSKFVDLAPLTQADAARVAKMELYKGFGDGARAPRKKNGWRVFYENCVKWIGASVHEMRRLWPNGETSRRVDFGYADDMADYFSSLGHESPEAHTFTTTYKADGFEATMHETIKSTEARYVSTRSFEQVVITKRGAEVCGVVIGSATRDELVAMFGAPRSEEGGRVRYPGVYSDGEEPGDDILPYFYVDFKIEGGVVTGIEIAMWPVG